MADKTYLGQMSSSHAQSLSEISNSPLILDYVAPEYKNYIMLALEGQRFVKLEKNYKEDKNECSDCILFLTFNYLGEEMSAQHVSQVLS